MQKDGFCLLAKIQVITNCVLSLLVNWFDWFKNQASAVGFVSSYTTTTEKAINHAAGWSDNKKQYLLDCVKFK